MIRSAHWVFALALLPLAACSGGNNTPMAATSTPQVPQLASVDQTFINTAAQGDAAEIASARLAATNARSPRVKAFAQKMITDHTQTTTQLAPIAQAKGVTPPNTPSDSAQATMQKLQGEKGAAFDRDYIADQVTDHQAMVQAFQDEIANGTDPDVKAFAQQNLPIVQQHLAMAQRLQGGASTMRHGARRHSAS